MPKEFLLPPDAQARHDMLDKMQASAQQKRETDTSRGVAQVDDAGNQEPASGRSEKPRE